MNDTTLKRKLFQRRMNLSNGILLGMLKRKALDDKLIETGFADTVDDLYIWREELIVELYDEQAALHDMETFPQENIYSHGRTGKVSDEETIGFLEGMSKVMKNNEHMLKYKAFLIKKLYNELPHVKEFNELMNSSSDVEDK